MTDDEAAIRQVVETWMAASRKGDLETVLGLMTDDVVFMVPGKEPFGKAAFAVAFKGMGETKVEGVSEARLGFSVEQQPRDASSQAGACE